MPKIYIFKTDQNILNIIALRYFKSHDLVVLKDPNFISNYSDSGLIDYLKREGRTFKQQALNPYNIENIERLKEQTVKDDVVVIPCSGYAYTLNMTKVLSKRCNLCYVEEDGDLYVENNGVFEEVKLGDIGLDVNDFIENFGGDIESSSEDFFNEPAAKKVFDLIADNLDAYNKLMRPIPIKSHFYDKRKVFVELSKLNNKPEAKALLDELLDMLGQFGICDSQKKKNQYILYFHDKNYKEILSKAGTWLEAITYRALNEIKSIDSQMSSVKFYWKTGIGKVINEIDVMGIHDNQLILISCKDTHNHTETTLYELFTHGEQLGFNSTKKILVTTNKPNEPFTNRAEDLDVDIIFYDGSFNNLRDALEHKILY